MYVLGLVGVVFKTMHIDWDNTMVVGISGIKIDMPSDAKVLIFTDNDLTHINVTSAVFESKDDPTQMTKIVIYNYILYYIQKTIHSKLICTNVHS